TRRKDLAHRADGIGCDARQRGPTGTSAFGRRRGGACMRRLRLFVVVAIVAWGCATNPATGRRQLILMSESEEIALGRQSDAEIRQQMGVYDDPELQAYVASVGRRLLAQAHRPALPWTFTVVDQPAVNAFALPGGFIYITR